MIKSQSSRFQYVLQGIIFLILFTVFLPCQLSWASQEAMVLADRAIIFSDQEMSSPVGYVPRGKKVVIGEIPRNKAQVYPIIVSGKVCYIRALDVTTEKENMEAGRLTAERFMKNTLKAPETKIVLSYVGMNATIAQNRDNANVKDGDPVFFNGVSFKSEVLVKKYFDIQMHLNHLFSTEQGEEYRIFEFGPGLAFRIIDTKYFILRGEGQVLFIPFSTYALGEQFRKKSYGYTAGAGVNATILFGANWGIEGYTGIYYSKLLGFDAPEPYQDVSMSFSGTRIGIGVNYTFE